MISRLSQKRSIASQTFVTKGKPSLSLYLSIIIILSPYFPSPSFLCHAFQRISVVEIERTPKNRDSDLSIEDY